MNYGFAVTKLLNHLPYFRNFDDVTNLRTQLPDAFHLLVPQDNFRCQTPLKNAKFDLFGSENVSWKV